MFFYLFIMQVSGCGFYSYNPSPLCDCYYVKDNISILADKQIGFLFKINACLASLHGISFPLGAIEELVAYLAVEAAALVAIDIF